jgi:hypothetical protein
MRSIPVLATVAAATVLGAAPAHATETTTEHQRGIVLECTGHSRGHTASVTLYENDLHGNVVTVRLDDDPRRSGSREPARDFWADGRIATGVQVAGHRARVVGTAHRVGPRRAVHEVNDDAGNHIVSDGFHRRLAHDLSLRYAGRTTALTCSPAFFYSLEVATTPIG